MEEEIKDKIYLNSIQEISSYKNKLRPIRQKILISSSEQSKASQSLPDLFKSLNGTIIMQNWNTKKNIPKEIEEYSNFPAIIDKKKFLNIKKLNIANIKKGNLSLLDKIRKTKLEESLLEPKKIEAIKITDNNYYNKIVPKEFFKKKSIQKRSNSTLLIDQIKEGNSTPLVPLTDRTYIRSLSKEIKTESIIKIKKKKKLEAIDFSTFKQYLLLRDNDFLYAKRIGGPLDFALCSYKDINKNFKLNKFKTNIFSKGYVNKNIEYLTISKNTILHYQKGIPQIYSINDWINNYIKYKKLMNLSLFKNFKSAKLFELWKRYYRKKQRLYYSEKFIKRTIFAEPHLLEGIFEIRRILKEMSYYDILKLNILSPVFLHKFNQIHLDTLYFNNIQIEKFRTKIKNEISSACYKSYISFKNKKNIILDDNIEDEQYDKKEKKEMIKNNNNKKEELNSIKIFLKEAIPYAQDATKKKHFKKILRFIRLVDFLVNKTKFELIMNSLFNLNKKFERLYNAYQNKWNDIPLLITMIITIGDKISYNPSIELIKGAIFDNYIQENIYAAINVKNFLEPDEFPQYVTCFEQVFDNTADQNGALNIRIRENFEFQKLYNNIKLNFQKCHEALEKEVSNLGPSLRNYNKFIKLNFKKIEEEADHNELINYIHSFKAEDQVVRKLNKIINIGIFEFHLDLFLEQIVDIPFQYLKKIYEIIPKILVRKVEELSQQIERNYDKVNLDVENNDIEIFIKLKKAVENCNSQKNDIEDKIDEIQELNNIILNYKEIRLEDFERRKYDNLINIKTKYDRKLDIMGFYIEQNKSQFRALLMVKIRKYDEMLKKIHNELNEELVNKYNENTLGPILFLEEKSFRISKAIENKKIFQQQEIDIEMEEHNKSYFQHLDLVTYEYDLKVNIWKYLHEYQECKLNWEKSQLMEIDLKLMEDNLKKWKKECIIALKDLVDADVAKVFLEKIKKYEKIMNILKIIYNKNIQKIDYLKQLLKNALNIKFNDFSDNNFLLENLISQNDLFKVIPNLEEINKRANEEQRIGEIYKEVLVNINSHHIPLKVKVNNEKGTAKYIINYDDFDKEQEFIDENLSKLNKELLNPYVSVIERDLKILINNIYKYQYFLEIFFDYQLYLEKVDDLIYNSDFGKEFPGEFKKLANESLTKSLMKILKDSLVLNKYFEGGHEKAINTLKTLVNNYEINYKSIKQFLYKKRREFQEYYLLNDDDLIELIKNKDSYEIRQKLLLKIFIFIEFIDPGKESDENLKFITKNDKEEVVLKYNKMTRTFREGVECLQVGLSKKMKDFFKSFKKSFDNSIKPKSMIRPKNLVNDLINNQKNSDTLFQLIFICTYHVIFYSLEKALEKENESFDKMFDLYNELKDEWKKNYVKMLKSEKNIYKTKLLISIISIINYFIKSIENLIREDVVKTTDFAFNKVLQIKIENDSVNVKYYNHYFEYGNEYTGLKYDFFVLPQTEKTILSIINNLYLHNPFIIYNNQSYFKKEIFNIVSNILGRYIFYFTSNQNFGLSGLNNIIYGNMRSGQVVCIHNIELINLNCLKIITQRIDEIFRLIHCKLEEGNFNDRNGEKYLFNNKKFNLFLTYNIDSFLINNKNHYLPLCIKNNFRCIGINYIDFNTYIKLIFNSYRINKSNEIISKINFIINGLIYKGNLLNKKNLKEVIIPHLFKKLKNELIIKRSEINKKTINNIVKKCLLDIIIPFIQNDINFKEEIETLINITLFDYEECEKNSRIAKMKKNKQSAKKLEEKNITKEEKLFIDSFAKFHFDKGNYIKKIESLYDNLKFWKSFILLGPPLSGKTISLVYLREISIKLNEINNDRYPIFSYIKIYPNYKNFEDVFIFNDTKFPYQNNNVYIKKMIDFLDKGENYLNELHNHYKKLFYIENKEKKQINNNNIKESINEDNNWNVDSKKVSNTIKKENKIIIFDGNISFEWCNYLTNYINEYNNYSLQDGDYINLSNKKIIFETSSLSKISPSFITKQNIISFEYDSFDWLNICYSYIETNYKIIKNEELKNYIKGLFENYLPTVIDFIETNKLKNFSFSINNNFIIKNLINMFDTFLPDFDFTDIKIGRRNDDYIPRIDIIKNQTMSIFIFCTAWIMNLLTNFLIKNKIEKVISDLFKTNDIKGPIFDYYLDENNSFCLWSNLLNNSKYNHSSYKKNDTYYYGHDFIYTIDNIPYFYLLNKLILSNISIFVFGKQCSGLSFLIRKCLDELEFKDKQIKAININMTYDMDSNYIEKKINKNMDILLRRKYGDKYQRKTIVYIDDVHLNKKINQFNEFMRYLLNEKLTYDIKYNEIKYYKDFNVINSGNYYNNILKNNDINTCYYEDNDDKLDFARYLNHFSLITLNLSQSNYISLYKPALEFHFRTYVPNISNIISNQYLSVLFKINELLNEKINSTYYNIHYLINIRDIIKIIQAFNKFIFKGTNEYTEYIKKIFIYETYSLYFDKFYSEIDIEIFKNIFVKSYNSTFKQDKIDINIFNNIDKDNSYICCKNFLDVYNENKENKYIAPKDLEYVLIEKKSHLKKYVIEKMKNFYNDYYFNGGVKGTEDIYYPIYDYNDYMINTIIRIIRALDNKYPNIILIGKNYTGKEIMLKIALYIMNYKYIDINLYKLLTKNKKQFEEETIIKALSEVVFNNKKIFLLFQNEIFNNMNEKEQLYIFELISSLIDPDIVLEKYNTFLDTKNDKNNYYKEVNLSIEEIKLRLKNNLQIILSIDYLNFTYNTLFTNYTNIAKKFITLFIHNYDVNTYIEISSIIFSRNKCNEEMLNKNILVEIHNYAKELYEIFGEKLKINIPINQRNYFNMCEFFAKNYKKYKDILNKKGENYEKIFKIIDKINKVIEEKEKLIEDLTPNKEQNDKLIEETRKIIREKITEKNKVKSTRSAEDKKLKELENEKEINENKFEDLFIPLKDTLRKIGGSISRFTDKDIVDCKNTWENFQFGKFLLSKFFLILDDGNGNDYDYVKKNLTIKQLKRFINIDFITNRKKYQIFIKEIIDNPDFGGLDKYNKNYKLAGLICEYVLVVNKLFNLYDENIELKNEISSLEKKIEEIKTMINNYTQEFKRIDKEIDEIQRKIEIYELNRNNANLQIDKYKELIKTYKIFLHFIKENENLWMKNKLKIDNLLKYFDYYLIFISAYINYAPILNYHYRLKFKNHLLNLINENIEKFNNEIEKNKNNITETEAKNIKILPIEDINFVDLMLNFLDITGEDKEMYTSSCIYKTFLRENFIIMHIYKNKIPFIIDYTQYSKLILSEYLEFERMQGFQTVDFNNNSNEQNNEFKDKLNKALKNGMKLFIDGITNVNKLYYLLFNYINNRFSGDKYKKIVIIDDHKYIVHDNFALYLIKNIIGEGSVKIDNNIWFNMLFINFNISKDEIKEKIFLDICKKRNELAYNNLKKIRNEKIKESLRKIITEKKMLNFILELDTSGSIDKLANTKIINEKYSYEYQLYSNIKDSIESLDNRYKTQRKILNEFYDKISNHASNIFKWIYRFNILKISYIMSPSTLIQYLFDFIEEKIMIKRKIIDEKNKQSLRLKQINNDDESEENYINEENLESKSEKEEEEKQENTEEEKENLIISVKEEEFIYENKDDIKSLIIYFYNRINKIYIRKDLQNSLLLLFGFLYVNFQRINPISFKHCFLEYYLWNSNFDEMIHFDEKIESPSKNITSKLWTILNKINISCAGIFQDLIDKIEKENEKWDNYLSEEINNENKNNNYYFNNLILPDINLEKNTDPLIKFMFFSIIKPNKKEFIINLFLKNTIYKKEPSELNNSINSNNNKEEIQNKNGNYAYEFKNEKRNNSDNIKLDLNSGEIIQRFEDYDLIKSFKNFNLKKDYALILFSSGDNLNSYDNILYNYCYLNMFNFIDKSQQTISNNIHNEQNSNELITIKNNKINEENKKENVRNDNIKNDENSQQIQGIQTLNDIKYKEIILNNNDLTQQDYDFIKNYIKIGSVIIIKNANILGNQFDELINDINKFKIEDISPSFRLILICKDNEIIQNKLIYEKCRIINDTLQLEKKIDYRKNSIKNNILNIICKIPLEINSILVNNNNIYMRLFLRKLIYHYLLIFGLLKYLNFNNPFYFSNNDFYSLCKFIIFFLENELSTEEKYNDFINIENNSGYNYISLINILNNLFIVSRLIEKNDEIKINKLINDIFSQKNFMSKEYYLNFNNIQIKTSDFPLINELLIEDIFNSFNSIYSEEFSTLLIYNSNIEENENQLINGEQIYENIINVINNNSKIINESKNSLIKLDMKFIKKYLAKLEENIPKDIPYIIEANTIELENIDVINASLFKKNKYGIYFNCLDESLYYEISLLNNKLDEIHKQISIIKNMINGNINYNIEYYKIFSFLSQGKIPQILNIYNKFDNFNNNINIDNYLEFISKRINIFKNWLRDGQLEYYYLPIFTNIELFFHSLKMQFSRKYYGENDYSRITPDMIDLKFIPTKYKTFNELLSEQKDFQYYKNLYKNEIIWVDGLILNNANFYQNTKYIFLNNIQKGIKNKMNIIGITYTIKKYEDNMKESETTSEEDEHEEKEEIENEVNSNKEELHINENNIINEEEKKDIINKDNEIKVYIYGNKESNVFNKYFESNYLGYISFYLKEKNSRYFIHQHDIKITIEDLKEFQS